MRESTGRKNGFTKRGLSGDYAGENPLACNAPTKSGRPCRAMALSSGRCKMHGGTGEGPRAVRRAKAIQDNLVAQLVKLSERNPRLREKLKEQGLVK